VFDVVVCVLLEKGYKQIMTYLSLALFCSIRDKNDSFGRQPKQSQTTNK